MKGTQRWMQLAGVVIAITTNVSDGGFRPVLRPILLRFVGS
jgi:hypothetical protein